MIALKGVLATSLTSASSLALPSLDSDLPSSGSGSFTQRLILPFCMCVREFRWNSFFHPHVQFLFLRKKNFRTGPDSKQFIPIFRYSILWTRIKWKIIFNTLLSTQLYYLTREISVIVEASFQRISEVHYFIKRIWEEEILF